MDNFSFKHGDIEVFFISTEKEDGSYAVEIKAEGDKAQVEAFMKDIVASTAHLNLPVELSLGKEGEPAEPLKVSTLMGGN